MRSVERLLARFGGAVAAVGLATSPVLAQADSEVRDTLELRSEAFCGDLYRTSTGRQVDASFTAHNYSQQNIGKIGVSIFAGQDLGEHSPEFLGTALVNSLRRRGVEAECFVHHEEMPNGTGVNFHIAGLTYSEESLSISEALNAEVMDALAAEAKTAGMLLVAANRPDFTNR